MKNVYTWLGFYCFSCGPFCGSPGSGGWQFHSGVYGRCHSKLLACGALHWDKPDIHVGGFFFLAPGSTWGRGFLLASFYILIFLCWSAAVLHPVLLSLWCHLRVRYNFVSHVAPKTRFVQFQVCISLTACELLVAVESSVPSCGLLVSHACSLAGTPRLHAWLHR